MDGNVEFFYTTTSQTFILWTKLSISKILKPDYENILDQHRAPESSSWNCGSESDTYLICSNGTRV